MKKLLSVLLALSLTLAVCISCGKEKAAETITETENENVIVVEAESQTVVTDKEEIANLVQEYGIPVDADSIDTIIDTKIDASVFD